MVGLVQTFVMLRGLIAQCQEGPYPITNDNLLFPSSFAPSELVLECMS